MRTMEKKLVIQGPARNNNHRIGNKFITDYES